MKNLLEELYRTDIHDEKFHFRKLFLEKENYQINGIAQSGKTTLVKNYLLGCRRGSYLYIDCNDLRIEYEALNTVLQQFCTDNTIEILVLDNYQEHIRLVNVAQLILCSEVHHKIDFLKRVRLYPLDYEEFLAYEHKYDSTALNHFFQLGGFAFMHKIRADERIPYLQTKLRCALDDVELALLIFCTKMMTQKISPYAIYERLKQTRKISKDRLYRSFDALSEKGYIHQLQKVDHPKAIRKIYLCDITLKPALTIEKHFGRIFENMVYLELLKSGREIFYDEGIDFYLPKSGEVVLSTPFTDERSLFKKVETIEAFIIGYQIKKITAITMSKEGSVNHPFSKVEMIPFDIWALGD